MKDRTSNMGRAAVVQVNFANVLPKKSVETMVSTSTLGAWVPSV